MRLQTRIKLADRLIEGSLVDRPNRYLSHVKIDNQIIEAFVPNPGRMTELMVPDYRVLLRKATNINRKTCYDLVAVYYNMEWVCIDSLIPNKFLYQALSERIFDEFSNYSVIRKEVQYENSRFDYYLDGYMKGCFIEAKSCTLVEDGVALFPDAPTKRGVKHLNELVHAFKKGYEAYVIIVIQRGDAKVFKPNGSTDPDFEQAMKYAVDMGVKVLAISTILSDHYIQFKDRVKVVI